jgi:dolichol-phosphate mannosyltransferase
MPAYNEEANIESVISQWHPVVEKLNNGSKLLIVNDGSKDNTYKILLDLQKKYPLLISIDKLNSGHGASCLYAYRKAIEAEADYIFQTDSDGQTNPDEIWQFWENRNNYDFIIGYRKKRQDGFIRTVVTRTLKLLVWQIFGENVKDPNTPFRLMNADKLKPILEIIPEDFFLSNVIISMLVVKRKEKHLWLPISFKPRQGGINSINLKRIIKIGYKAIADFYYIKRKMNKQHLWMQL